MLDHEIIGLAENPVKERKSRFWGSRNNPKPPFVPTLTLLSFKHGFPLRFPFAVELFG
jgi:hypothetical protein